MRKYDLIVFDWNGTLSEGLETDSSEIAPLRKGVPDLLAALDQDQYLLAIASNMPTRQLLLEARAYDIDHYFIEIHGPDAGFCKPHPYMLQQILQQTGIMPERALMVGDAQIDAQFANHAGVECLLINNGSSRGQSEYQNIGQINDINDLLDVI